MKQPKVNVRVLTYVGLIIRLKFANYFNLARSRLNLIKFSNFIFLVFSM